MKKALLITLTCFLFTMEITAQGYLWVKQSVGEVGIGSAEGRDVVCDNEGNTYVVGNFNNTTYFGDLQVAGNYGIMYVVKYDLLGNPVWARQINGSSNNEAYGIAVDNEQNIYICGMYKQTNENTILDFGTIQVAGNPSLSTFLAMIDKDGNWQWVNTMLSGNPVGQQYCIPDEIQVTPEGDVFLAGTLNTSVTIDGNLYNTENGSTNAYYLARFSSVGDLVWFTGGAGLFNGIELTFATDGRLFFAGTAHNTIYFENDSITGPGDDDVLFGAINQDGNLLWWQTAGHPSFIERPKGIEADQNNNIYLAFSNLIWVQIGDLTVDYNGVADQYLYKFDDQGNFLWIQPLYNGTVGGVNGIRVRDILTEASGKTYVTGWIESPSYFGNPLFFTDTVGGFGYKECFLAAYNNDGSYADVVDFIFAEDNDAGEFVPSHMVFDHDMNIAMTGTFRHNLMVGDVLLEADLPVQMFVLKVKPSELFEFSSGIFNGRRNEVDMVNYPNPFSTSTTIEYELNQPEKVSLRIYNHLGQLIYQTEENQPQGKQQLIWNTEGYADGIYYYRLQAGEQIASGKMVKVR